MELVFDAKRVRRSEFLYDNRLSDVAYQFSYIQH